ncbi:hypothetical protein [Hyphomonas sp. UBA4494]|jgi:hypothetical protein|uniref:hypothetical protein n=1 Tax=Hyphomonas sp. UBA4494 TaxID=1946631 RepID=UPI0025BAB179|nr:hypothetical protein [Hyphomonas sp. UBA4494]
MTRDRFKPLTDRLGVLFDPRFWMRTHNVDDDWDRTLAAALYLVEHNAKTIEDVTDYSATVAGMKLWVGNWPHAFGSLYHVPNGMQVLPRRKTAIRLREHIIARASADRAEAQRAAAVS